MKNSFLLYCRTTLKNIPAMRILAIAILFCLSSHLDLLHAQTDAKLSVQGILKKASGEAVPDDTYSLTFRLYTSPTAPVSTALWTETQPAVDVVSGIYSTVLGNTMPLTVPFNVDYYLGVSVNSTEMTPRIQLTSAPYALSVRGEKNKFPSTGIVIADSLRVNGGVLARGGAPGLNGVTKNGYAFTTNTGDKDSGLFSLGNNQVSLFANNVEEVRVTPDSVVINGEVRPESMRLDNGGKISYNGLNDWRLVETDYFDTDAEGWKYYNQWNSGSGTAASVTTFPGDFAGKALVNNVQNNVFKKKFTLPGSSVAGTYTYVKVVFKYFYLDTWDFNGKDLGFAGFSKTENCAQARVGWTTSLAFTANAWALDATGFDAAATFTGSGWSDQWTSEQMVARYPSGPSNTDFWLFFGYGSDGDPTDENYAISMIEIWVK